MNVRRLFVSRGAKLLSFAAIAACFGSVSEVRAQAWPTKPITLVAPFPPAGAVDIVARLLAEILSQELKQPVVVNNRPGAAGIIGANHVAKAAPDGYTLLMSAVTAYAMWEAVPANRGRFDYREAFTTVSLVSETPFVLIVGNGVPARNLQEFISYARQNPRKLNEVTNGEGSSQEFVGRLFAKLTGVETTRVPYQGIAASFSDFAAGRVDLNFGIPLNVVSLEGKARPLVIASRNRAPYLPKVPTSSEEGLPDFLASSVYAIAAPKGLPRDVADTIHRAVSSTLKNPQLVKRFQDLGIDVLSGGPDEAERRTRLEYDTWLSVTVDSNEGKGR
ncbi:MAG: Bug family tripartite tricarboxylate transporter substrate binding protein [Burkholderiaceae bacterium]